MRPLSTKRPRAGEFLHSLVLDPPKESAKSEHLVPLLFHPDCQWRFIDSRPFEALNEDSDDQAESGLKAF